MFVNCSVKTKYRCKCCACSYVLDMTLVYQIDPIAANIVDSITNDTLRNYTINYVISCIGTTLSAFCVLNRYFECYKSHC